ncbi:MAG TPA: Rad52/Rad22 family DNA repair protein [Gemmatimonadaceae bacterium]|nr:Rad52/Rad22 family DNA repair protein [Gemmatimonadaceae bacterium]
MIARHETHMDKMDIWSKLSAPLPTGVISWRQDGKAVQRDGKFVARFVAYIDANTVRERLDSVVPGEWDLTLDLLPTLAGQDENGEQTCSFKARLQILGVIREDVGTGRDYKSAATDAFKRAAVRFGIAHELYGFEQNWVPVDGDGRYAKPLEDPAVVYARRLARMEVRERIRAERQDEEQPAADEVHIETTLAGPATGPLALDEPSCPKCGGRMWDNRLSKRNPKAPDFKCRNRSCDGVIWPAKAGQRASSNGRGSSGESSAGPLVPEPEPVVADADQIPF